MLTWASDPKEPSKRLEYKVFFDSYLKYNSLVNTDLVVFSHDPGELPIPPQSLKAVSPDGFSMIIRDRFLFYWDFLTNNKDYYRVLLVDSRDVLFQADVFHRLACDMGGIYCQPENDKVRLISEGMLHRDSPWNINDQIKCQRALGVFSGNHLDFPVLSGGVMLGPLEKIRQLCMLVWSTTLHNGGGCTDQGVLNYLWRYLSQDDDYVLHDPTIDDLVATGEGIKIGLNPSPYFQDGSLHCPATKRPYGIFHQWDRTEHASEIRKAFE